MTTGTRIMTKTASVLMVPMAANSSASGTPTQDPIKYGLPLAAHVKDLGKQAVHMGGALQIFFGIKGGRWDENPKINRFYNEHWTRPLPSETPQTFQNVEEGCYW